MSSSSSTESEKILNKKLKEQHVGYDEVLTSSGRGLFVVESDLFKPNDDEDVLQPQKIPAVTENIPSGPFSPPSLAANEEENYENKENESSLFTNVEKDSDPLIPVAKQRKVSVQKRHNM